MMKSGVMSLSCEWLCAGGMWRRVRCWYFASHRRQLPFMKQ